MTPGSPVGAPPPPDERLRLAALHALNLLDTPNEERFDRITRTAQRVLRVPIALISFVDADRQWFKSCLGLDDRETDRSVSFCAWAIHGDDPFVVPETHADPRFVGNPYVTGSPYIRGYLGIPLHATDGYRVGTLCVLDDEPRQFPPEDVAALVDLARWAEAELSHKELAVAVAGQRAVEERLRAVLDAAPEGVATFDRAGTILSMNAAGERLFGCSADALVGQRVRALLAVDAANEELVRRAALLRPGDEPLRAEVTGCRADGRTLPLEVSIAPLAGHAGAAYVVAARDLTERKRAQDALEGVRRRLELILEATAEGICGLDADGLFLFANPAARRMFGLGPDEDVTGISLHERFHSRRPDGTPYPWPECPSYRALHQAEPVQVRNEVFLDATGAAFAVEYTSAPVVEHGTATGVVVSFTDVTDRREVERMKDEFISVVSHELRTPLTSIRGSLGLLASGAVGPLSSDAQRMTDIAVSNTDRLIRLINDILDLERIESGLIELERAPVVVSQLLADAVATVEGVAERAGVAIRVVASGEDVVWVDPDRMVRALSNLLSNAVKFSAAGQEVELAAAVAGDVLQLRVADRGRGIPAAMQERIFDRFQQVDASDSRERSGTGLGLAIVKSIVEQHGGGVSVVSEPGRGSAFTVTVPCAPSERAGEATAPRARPVVLVVEDDPDLSDVLSTSLVRRGVDVARAAGQAEAVAEAARLRPDLLVLDLGLAEGDGFGVVEEMRRDRALDSTPLLVYTVRDLDSHDRRRLALGPTEYLTKGATHPDDIERRVLAMVGRDGGDPAARRRRVLLVDDDPSIQEVAVLALETLGNFSVTLAGSGDEGVAAARRERPDMILLDVMMPEVDGPATLARLRDDPSTATIPVVFLTAKTQSAEKQRLASMDVAGILSKPFDPVTLASDLSRLMGWS